MQDNYSKWSARERIRELPETEDQRDDDHEDEEEDDRRSSGLVVVGRARGPLAEAAAEYEARLGRALRLEVLEVREEPLQRGTVGRGAGARAPARSSRTWRAGRIVALDRVGRALRLPRASRRSLRDREERPPQRTAFVIGGPDRAVARRCWPRAEPAPLARPADAAAPARARRAGGAALPRDDDPARGAVPPLERAIGGPARRSASPLPPCPRGRPARLPGSADRRRRRRARRRLARPTWRWSGRRTPRTATTRRRSRCGWPSRSSARRATWRRRSRARIASDDLDSVDVAGPGFLNLRLSAAWYRRALAAILAEGDALRRRAASRPSGC